MPDTKQIRDGILAAPLEGTHWGGAPQAGTLYMPPSHLKAIKPEANIVVGGRGVGKSFWTSVLNTPGLRAIVGLEDYSVSLGFAQDPQRHLYPDQDTIASLLNSGCDPYDMWRAVILRWAGTLTGTEIPSRRWSETIDYLRNDPEAVAEIMENATRRGRAMIVFDALDRTSNDWQRMDKIVRGLMRVVLWLKPYPNLTAKVFLREDQAERTVFDFPDASKLQATRANLSWERHDLHGMLWQRLINAPEHHGQTLRQLCNCTLDAQAWRLDGSMKRETPSQKKAFEALAGPWMGRDRRRGVPYTWSVGHLADGRGYTSPRSFSAAIYRAAEESRDRYPDHDRALHFEAIKSGIQAASQIRVDEVAEDYAWIRDVLGALEGLTVPCSYEEVIRPRWEECFPRGTEDIPSDRLPPQHATRGWDGVYDDLQRMGMVELMRDGRFNMPDLYRVGFGLGRRGGVRPRRNTAQ
ncbi:MAG: hypothetical protein FKY71_06650 [Spiribacter salinus]|uniref:Uncharacterized protein n=1 Tax=Spiribacter salinus TaxID=1335746 RepID=A0A540VSS4_9GAMM|nr:MAG: hypothetical protein FKY71_06650 [Spiribacter salinus]